MNEELIVRQALRSLIRDLQDEVAYEWSKRKFAQYQSLEHQKKIHERTKLLMRRIEHLSKGLEDFSLCEYEIENGTCMFLAVNSGKYTSVPVIQKAESV